MAWSKESRQSRGYGQAWTAIRKKVLERDKGLCQPSLKKGLVVVATEVDHIVSKAEAKRLGWPDSKIDHPSNLQAISKLEHQRKSTEETGRTFRPKVEIGLDGWPVET